MKYEIGQQVWRASWEATETFITCPDCDGQGRIRVMLPDDRIVSCECVGCKSGYASPKGFIMTLARRALAVCETITGFELDDGKMEWRTSGTYRVSEDTLFEDEASAKAAAEVLATKADTEERTRLLDKEKPTRSWAWNASYHRKCLKEAHRNVEYHTGKLTVANLKAKANKVTQKD
jgi:Zn ribbon nucleic-acid-binding protein